MNCLPLSSSDWSDDQGRAWRTSHTLKSIGGDRYSHTKSWCTMCKSHSEYPCHLSKRISWLIQHVFSCLHSMCVQLPSFNVCSVAFIQRVFSCLHSMCVQLPSFNVCSVAFIQCAFSCLHPPVTLLSFLWIVLLMDVIYSIFNGI